MASVLNDEMKTSVIMAKNQHSLKLSDCTCPICMYILVEPVTMPCKHELCMTCFKQNVQESSLTCPMCRVRISTWARRAAKSNTLINHKRWSAIKKAFPEKVQKRIEGKEDDSCSDEDEEIMISLAKPGEIRKEYEEQLRKLEEERIQKEKAELEASARLISELQKQEMKENEKRQQELEKLAAQDEELAHQLASKLNESTSETLNDSTAEVLKLLEERSTVRSSRSSSRSTCSASSVMDKFLAKGKRQQEMKASEKKNGSYSYSCISPWQKEEKDSENSSQDKCEDDILVASLLDIFGPPVSESPEPTFSSEGMKDEDLPLMQEEDRGGTQGSRLPKTPPGSMAPPSSSVRRSDTSYSEDSITQELVHFRPIHASPKTPPRRLPGGRMLEPKLIRSTPINLGQSNMGSPRQESDMASPVPQPGMQSPVMKRRLQQLASERQFQVTAQSKSTTTEPANVINMLDHSKWVPNKKEFNNAVTSALSVASGKVPIKNLFKNKTSAAATVSSTHNMPPVSPPVKEELPCLPDLPATISDEEDDVELNAKTILPLESNVNMEEDMNIDDLPAFGINMLNTGSCNSFMDSEHSQSSDKLYIAECSNTQSSVLWPVSSQSEMSCTNQSLIATAIMKKSPLSCTPSLLTSETLSSSRCSTSASVTTDSGKLPTDVNFKVMDESARMGGLECGQGDSHSHLGLNVLQIGKLEDGVELHPAQLHQVYSLPLGMSPTGPNQSSSPSSAASIRDVSISCWFQKWSDRSAGIKTPETDNAHGDSNQCSNEELQCDTVSQSSHKHIPTKQVTNEGYSNSQNTSAINSNETGSESKAAEIINSELEGTSSFDPNETIIYNDQVLNDTTIEEEDLSKSYSEEKESEALHNKESVSKPKTNQKLSNKGKKCPKSTPKKSPRKGRTTRNSKSGAPLSQEQPHSKVPPRKVSPRTPKKSPRKANPSGADVSNTSSKVTPRKSPRKKSTNKDCEEQSEEAMNDDLVITEPGAKSQTAQKQVSRRRGRPCKNRKNDEKTREESIVNVGDEDQDNDQAKQAKQGSSCAGIRTLTSQRRRKTSVASPAEAKPKTRGRGKSDSCVEDDSAYQKKCISSKPVRKQTQSQSVLRKSSPRKPSYGVMECPASDIQNPRKIRCSMCTDGKHCGTPTDLETKVKVDEDKENELEKMVLGANVRETGDREAIKLSVTPKKRRKNVFVEYTPGSGGKKLFVKRVAGKRTKTAAQTRLQFSSGSMEDEDTDDFTDSPVVSKRRKLSRNKPISNSSKGKQLTLMEMLSTKSSPESMEAEQSRDAEDDEVFNPEERLDRSHFSSDNEYKQYLEKLDMQMAMQLQAEFEFEAKYRLNCVRKKGSENSYSFRKTRGSKCNANNSSI